MKHSDENQSLDRSVRASSRRAAVNAVKLRFRPIMLTTITTVIGLLPVSMAKSAGIAGSMASTIVSGLLAASILMLIFLPISVVIIDDISQYFAEFNGRLKLKKTQPHFSFVDYVKGTQQKRGKLANSDRLTSRDAE